MPYTVNVSVWSYDTKDGFGYINGPLFNETNYTTYCIYLNIDKLYWQICVGILCAFYFCPLASAVKCMRADRSI